MTLLDWIETSWRVTPEYVEVDDMVIDPYWYADQGRWGELAAWSIYEEWVEPGTAYLGYDDPVVEEIDSRERAARYLAGSVEERADAQRLQLQREIDGQIPQPSVADTATDPGLESVVIRSAAAASDKQIELDDTDDADLDAFDPMIATAASDAAYSYSRLTLTIKELAPWAGAPSNNVGFFVTLEVQSDLTDEGAEARLNVVSAPSDVSAVLPFVQDTEAGREQFWYCEARDGHKWIDKDESCAVQLLWGAGSSIVSPVLQVSGFDDRDSAAVRYGIAA